MSNYEYHMPFGINDNAAKNKSNCAYMIIDLNSIH
jgi:hypothetical protein